MKLDWLSTPDPRITAAIDAGRPRNFWENFGQGKIGRRDYFICLAIMAVIYVISPRIMPGIAWLFLFLGRARDIERKLWTIASAIIVIFEVIFLEWTLESIIENYGPQISGIFIIVLLVSHVCFAVILGLQRAKPSAARLLEIETGG